MKEVMLFLQAALFCMVISSNANCMLLRSEVTNVKNFKPTLKKNNNILIGMLLPMKRKDDVAQYDTGIFYASAMFIAMDEINKNKTLLPHHDLQLVWGDTECDVTKTLALQDRFEKLGVDVFIGGGCADCEEAAKHAEQRNIAIISYQCQVANLASKYDTFVDTSLKFNHLFSDALEDLLRYYKWERFAVVFENSTYYRWTLNHIQQRFGANIVITVSVPSVRKYTFKDDFDKLKKNIFNLKDKASIIVVLTSIRMMKEVIVAAYELDMADGKYVFLTTLLDIPTRNKQKPYNWAIVDHGKGGFRNFIERSNNLCNGYKATFLIAVKRTVDSKTAKYSKFLKDVETGMKKWFNVTVYTGLIPGTNYSKELSTPPLQAGQMYDAIMFYAKAVNKLLIDNKDYKSGSNVQDYFHNSTVTGITGHTFRYGKKGQLYHPLHIYRFPSYLYDGFVLVSLKQVGDFVFTFTSGDLKATYQPWKNTTILWPGKGGIENVSDDPQVGKEDGGSEYNGKKKNMIPVIVGVGAGIVIFLVVVLLVTRYCKGNLKCYGMKLRTEEDQMQLEEDDEML